MSISERKDTRQFEKGLNRKVKFKVWERSRNLDGVGDTGTIDYCLIRSGTHGLNEERGRHRGGEQGLTKYAKYLAYNSILLC